MFSVVVSVAYEVAWFVSLLITTEDEAASDQSEAFYGLCGKGGKAQRSGSVIGSILFLVPFVSDTLRCMSSHNSDRDLRNSG